MFIRNDELRCGENCFERQKDLRLELSSGWPECRLRYAILDRLLRVPRPYMQVTGVRAAYRDAPMSGAARRILLLAAVGAGVGFQTVSEAFAASANAGDAMLEMTLVRDRLSGPDCSSPCRACAGRLSGWADWCQMGCGYRFRDRAGPLRRDGLRARGSRAPKIDGGRPINFLQSPHPSRDRRCHRHMLGSCALL